MNILDIFDRRCVTQKNPRRIRERVGVALDKQGLFGLAFVVSLFLSISTKTYHHPFSKFFMFRTFLLWERNSFMEETSLGGKKTAVVDGLAATSPCSAARMFCT